MAEPGEPAHAAYVYCVVPSERVPRLDELRGVDPAFAVEPVIEQDLCALTSRVSLASFGAEALRRELEDLAWVERTARAHDAVLARALAGGAVVPLRLCTIFADDAHVREMLARERGRLHDALRRLRGCAEWSVKVLAETDADRLRRDAERADDAPAAAPGRAFFARKQAERAQREQAHEDVTAIAQDVHDRLRAAAREATLLRPQDPALSRLPGKMVLNGAYLVEQARTAEFSAAVSEQAARHRAAGVVVDVSGPWAPYNFVATEQERDDERRAAAPGTSA